MSPDPLGFGGPPAVEVRPGPLAVGRRLNARRCIVDQKATCHLGPPGTVKRALRGGREAAPGAAEEQSGELTGAVPQSDRTQPAAAQAAE